MYLLATTYIRVKAGEALVSSDNHQVQPASGSTTSFCGQLRFRDYTFAKRV